MKKTVLLVLLMVLVSLPGLAQADFAEGAGRAGSAKDFPGRSVPGRFRPHRGAGGGIGPQSCRQGSVLQGPEHRGRQNAAVADLWLRSPVGYVEVREMKVVRAAGAVEIVPLCRGQGLSRPGPGHLLGCAGDHHPGRPAGARRRHLGQNLPEGVHLRPARRRGTDDRYIPPMKGHFYDIVPFYPTVPVLVKNYR